MELTMESQNEAPAPQPASEERGRSSVDFPYFDLDSGQEVAEAVREVGVTACDPASLATKLNMAPDGGGFRMRLLTAKTFGLIAYGRAAGGMVELTDLGRQIADPQTQRRARLDAFMAIPLYRTLFDRLKGQVLPPPPAIERLMESMGVAPKQKDKARQVFMRSAKQAGLFELSNDRMTLPPSVNTNAPSPAAPAATADEHPQRRRAGGGGGDDHLHPFIRGLIDKLPPPDSDWDLPSRAKWLTTAANIFDLMYQGSSDTGIKVKLEGSTLSIATGDLA
jgi:hypothetical protein